MHRRRPKCKYLHCRRNNFNVLILLICCSQRVAKWNRNRPRAHTHTQLAIYQNTFFGRSICRDLQVAPWNAPEKLYARCACDIKICTFRTIAATNVFMLNSMRRWNSSVRKLQAFIQFQPDLMQKGGNTFSQMYVEHENYCIFMHNSTWYTYKIGSIASTSSITCKVIAIKHLEHMPNADPWFMENDGLIASDWTLICRTKFIFYFVLKGSTNSFLWRLVIRNSIHLIRMSNGRKLHDSIWYGLLSRWLQRSSIWII